MVCAVFFSLEQLVAVLLAFAAVGILAAVGIGSVAVLVFGPRRPVAAIAPMLAAALGEILAAIFGSSLRLDAGGVLVVAAVFAAVVALFQRLREEPTATPAWLVGWLGWNALGGSAQGLFVGAAAAFITKDVRLVPILVSVGAVVRTIWAWGNRAIERTRAAEPAWAAEPASAAGPPTPEAASASAAGPIPTAEAVATAQPVPTAGPVATARPVPAIEHPTEDRIAAAPEPPSAPAPVRGPDRGDDRWASRVLKVLSGVAVAMLFGAVVLAGISSSITNQANSQVTVHNLTTVPISFSLPGLIGPASAPACATVVIDTARRSPGPVPSDAVMVDVERLLPFEGEGGPAPKIVLVITKDWELGRSEPDIAAASLPICAGVPRQKVSASGSGSQITPPFRLAGSYRATATVTAPTAVGCDFAAVIRSVGNPGVSDFELAAAFEVPPGGQPQVAKEQSFDDGTYELVLTTDCQWKVELDPA